ncbi:MAG TPA: VCBS repeat-containing protein, partial [Gemmataceae bacterium]|nr:VCBS repeat-containing protein [Gemmataceae bacterium]
MMTRRTPRASRAPIADRPSTFRPRLELLEGRNLPSFASPIKTALSAVVPGAAVGDFNGDGRQDLVAEGNGIRILLNRGNGTFLFDQTIASGAGSKVASGDFNRDGKVDVVVSANLPGIGTYAKVFLGDGAGKFRSTSATTLQGVPLVEPSFLVSGDFNGDGVTDVAVAGEDNSPGPVRR